MGTCKQYRTDNALSCLSLAKVWGNIHRLKQWKSSDSRKPLILRGARQVGKTTVVNEFGKTYANYLYYNMEQTQDRDVMEMDISMENLEMMLYASKGKENRGGDTLLFIDEIQ